ncbi:HEAT repeat domain-containing protein [Haliangium ochraceum]|uniref:HEAT repeat domain-containing protein n=1 Tax=Haliangium ochraceum TaxID=80816 RepID=UPI0002D99C8A|nr:HEAT repeat domain-containing protein [Haliangium ochraceum]
MFDPNVEKIAARAVIEDHADDVAPEVRGAWADVLSRLGDVWFRAAAVERFAREPDAEVQALMAKLLAALGANDMVPALREAMAEAAPIQAVWYADALCELEQQSACDELREMSSHQDLAVAFTASLAATERNALDDAEMLSALERLAEREVELKEFDALSGIAILSRLALLGHARARRQLYELLDHEDEGVRLSVATALAWSGDETGKPALLAVFNDGRSQRRVDAAIGLLHLGDATGYELLVEQLAHRDPELRRVSAYGLGLLSELDSARALIARYDDDDKRVRLEAAGAVLTILGLDPVLLSRESVAWVRAALRSEAWQVRQSAAAPIRYLNPDDGIALLAAGIVDSDPRVRRRFAAQAVHLGPEAAPIVAEALRFEEDPEVQEQQIIALAGLGNPLVIDTLQEIVRRGGRVGILSLGALIALGERDEFERLRSAFRSAVVRLRQAVMDAAALAGDRIVLPLLQRGLEDPAIVVREAAARALAGFKVKSGRVVEILRRSVERSGGDSVQTLHALLRLDTRGGGLGAPSDMLSSSTQAVRHAVVRAVADMSWHEARPVLQRAVRHPDVLVRQQAVGTLAAFADEERDEVRALLKILSEDADDETRVSTKAQLAHLMPPYPPRASPPDAAQTVRARLDEAMALMDEQRSQFDTVRTEINAILDNLSKLVSRPARSEKDVEEVERLAARLRSRHWHLLAERGKMDMRAMTVRLAVRRLPESRAADQEAAHSADGLRAEGNAAVTDSRVRVESMLAQVERWLETERADCELYITAAEASIATGGLVEARRDLVRANKNCRRGEQRSQLHFVWARYFEQRAEESKAEVQRRKFLGRARDRYERFLEHGSGFRVARAQERSAALSALLAARP